MVEILANLNGLLYCVLGCLNDNHMQGYICLKIFVLKIYYLKLRNETSTCLYTMKPVYGEIRHHLLGNIKIKANAWAVLVSGLLF